MYGISSMFGSNLFSYNTTAMSAYRKIMQSQYGKNTRNNSVSNSSSRYTSVISPYNNVIKKSDSLASDINKLSATGKNSVFATRQNIDADGNKTTAYNTDDIYKAVKSFADDYNSVIDSALTSGNQQIQRTAATMSGTTRIMSKALSDVGVKLGTDGKLSVDEAQLKNSDMSKVKNLFNGANSYARTIGSENSRVSSTANYQNRQVTSSLKNYNNYGLYGSTGTYGRSGSYGNSFSNYMNYYSMFNGFF